MEYEIQVWVWCRSVVWSVKYRCGCGVGLSCGVSSTGVGVV